MRRRTDRHIEESGSSPTRLSRMSKNKYLYDDINNVIGYEEITDFNPENGIDLSNIRNTNSREEYKKYKDYQDIFGKTEEKKEEAVEEEEKKICKTAIEGKKLSLFTENITVSIQKQR